MVFDEDDPRAEDATKDEGTEDPRDWGKPSRAVIAYSGKHGIVVWYVGAHVESMIEGIGGADIEELGFEGDPPVGISVWEGRTTGGRRTWEGDYDDAYLTGTYRTPNAEEWAAIQLHKNPWDKHDWLLPEHVERIKLDDLAIKRFERELANPSPPTPLLVELFGIGDKEKP